MGHAGGPRGPSASRSNSYEDSNGRRVGARLRVELDIRRRTRAGARSDRLAASLLLSGNVPAPADRRAFEYCVDAGFGRADLLHGGFSVAPAAGIRPRRATH